MANKFDNQQEHASEAPHPTMWTVTVDEAWQTWLHVQTTRVVENYASAGYAVKRVGTRPTRNAAVEMWRAEVHYPAAHPRSAVRLNVQTLIRAIFPGVQAVDLYEPDEVEDGICIAVWFAFDSKPLTSFR